MNTLSVQELIDKLQAIKNKSLGVYMVTDKSECNRNEDGNIINSYPIEFVEHEKINTNNGWEDDDIEDVLLIISDEQ